MGGGEERDQGAALPGQAGGDGAGGGARSWGAGAPGTILIAGHVVLVL